MRFLTTPGSFKEPIVVRHGNRVAPPVPSHLPAQIAWTQEPHRSTALLDHPSMALLDHQLFVKTGSSVPELSLFPTSLALQSGSRVGAPLLEHILLSPTPSYSLTCFLVTGNPTGRGPFFFLLSKSPWPLHHLNKHFKFHCGFRLREAKYRSQHTWLLLYFLP